jgi:ribosomal protein L29
MSDRSKPASAGELCKKSRSDLLSTLNELKTELASLRVAQVTGGNGAKLTKM